MAVAFPLAYLQFFAYGDSAPVADYLEPYDAACLTALHGDEVSDEAEVYARLAAHEV